MEQNAWKLENSWILAMQTCDSGYDYTLYNAEYQMIDGGQLDMPELSMEEARTEILNSFQLSSNKIEPVNYDVVMYLAESLEHNQNKTETKKETMKVVLVQPGLYAKEAEIGTQLRDMQQTVGGWIEAVYPYEDNVAIICNEEGLITGLPLNRQITNDIVIAGTFFVCGTGEENFVGLTDEQVKEYVEKFKMPEVFSMIDGKIQSIQVTEEGWGYLMGVQAMKAQERKRNGHER